MNRSAWTSLTEAQLLAQCEVDTYRASGPGGQKRNKTSSAVRLRHPGSGLIVIAEESRSQHENKARALKRLRRAFFLKMREQPNLAAPEFHGPLKLGRRDPRFWTVAGLLLDVLHAHEGRLSDAGKALGLTTGNLVDFLQTDPKLWEQANILRTQFGQKPLRCS